MQEAVVQSGQRIVADIPAGVPLHAAIDALCARHEIGDAEIRLQGTVRKLRLSADGGASIEGAESAQLVLAQGQVSGDLGLTGISAVLAWTDRGVPHFAAGTLEQAESAGVRVFIECWTEVSAPRNSVAKPQTSGPRAAEPARPERGGTPPRDPALTERPERVDRTIPGKGPAVRGPAEAAVRPTSRTPVAEPAPAPPVPEPAPSGGWASAVAASKSSPPSRPQGAAVTANGAGPLDEDPETKPGDILVHPQFGRCRVVGQVENEKIKLRTATGRFIDLHLGYVKLSRQADEEGLRVFRVTPSRR